MNTDLASEAFPAKPTQDMLRILREKFNVPSFQELQWEVVHYVLEGHDQIGIFSTNYGKSLMYQFPAEYGGHRVVLVVTPTIALMKDQVNSMQDKDVAACYLGSAQANNDQVIRDIQRGHYRLVYASPEFLFSPRGLDMVRNISQMISLLAIDEAHCIVQWGTFRPQFRKLGELRQTLLPTVPILALTASATPAMIGNMITSLKLKLPKITKSSLHRSNLYIQVRRKQRGGVAADIRAALAMQETLGPTIVFCATKKEAERIYHVLKEMQLRCGLCHSTAPDKFTVQEQFMHNEIQIVVATSSFGMGVNKKDVHCVIHYGPAWCLEDYFQQIGRAGRDGHPSYCIAFYNDDDFSQPWTGCADADRLHEMYLYLTDRYMCKKQQLLLHFGEIWGEKHNIIFDHCCTNCDLIIRELGEN